MAISEILDYVNVIKVIEKQQEVVFIKSRVATFTRNAFCRPPGNLSKPDSAGWLN